MVRGDILLKPTDISQLKDRQNIFFLGGKEYNELPNYLMNFDVCLLPYVPAFHTSPPTKIYDYLATGNPIVSTYFPELKDLGNLIKLARTKEEFIIFMAESLNEHNPEIRQMRIEKAQENSWILRTEEIVGIIANRLNSRKP